MKQIVFIALFNFVAFCTFAQDTAVNKQLIKPNQVYVCGGSFICNSRIYPFVELKNKFVTNPEAFKEYTKYESGAGWNNAMQVLFVTGFIGGIATLNSDKNLSGKIFLGSFISAFIGTHIQNVRHKHLNKAIAAYNKQF